MNTLIFIGLSVASSGLAALRVFWVEAQFNIDTVAAYMFFQSLLMLAAYSDFGVNQGVLYRSVQRSVRNRKKAAASIINGVIKKASLLCILFLILYYPIFLLLTKNALSNLQITILCLSYIVSLAFANFTQVYLRAFDYLVSLAVFNLLVSILTLIIMSIFQDIFEDAGLFYLLMSQPLSILIIFSAYIFLRCYNKLDLTVKSYPWYVVCNISSSGIYIALIGLLYGFFVIMDKIYMARLDHIDGSAVYVFFTVFSGIAITLSGFAYQAGFKYFFKSDEKSEFLQKNVDELIKYFFTSVTPLCMIFLIIIIYYLNNYQSEHLKYIQFIPLVIFTAINSVFVGFVNQYLLANYQHKIIFFYNLVVLGFTITLTEILFHYGLINSVKYFGICMSIVGLVYMMLLIIKAGASLGNVFYNIALFGAVLTVALNS